MSKLFLQLDDAVNVAMQMIREGMTVEDEEYVRQELEQKCYMPNSCFTSGYLEAICDIERGFKEFKYKVNKEAFECSESEFRKTHEKIDLQTLQNRMKRGREE